MELLRPEPLGDQISGVMRREIITGLLPARAAVKEESLAERFQVSRGPIREALHILEGEHLIQKTGRSYEVIGLARSDIDEIYALRRSLEEIAWTIVAQLRIDTAIAQATSHLEDMDAAVRTSDRAKFAEADVAFHSAIVRATSMKRLNSFWDQLEPSIRMILQTTNAMGGDIAKVHADHRGLLDALVSGDVEGTLRLLDDHLTSSRDILPHVEDRPQAGTTA